MTTAPLGARKLDQLDREELLATTRQLLAEAQALSSRIAALNEISVAINRTFDLEEILRVVARQAKWLLDYEHFSACLHEADGVWRVVTLFGPPVTIGNQELTETSNVGSVLRTGQSRLIKNTEPDMFLEQYASQIIVPLLSTGVVMGTIIFATSAPAAYKQDDLRIGYMLALQLASAIRNADHVQELNRVQAEMKVYTKELESSNHELDAYSHTIAHDLKTPLTSIGLNVDLVQRVSKNVLPPKAEQYLTNIKTASSKMATMIDQLLWLAKSRNASDTVKSTEIKPLVEAAVHRFHHQIEEREIKINISGELPPVLGHAQWIEEIFANLISNAIKYMGEDKAEPSIAIRGIRIGNCIRYEVIDTGVGISKEDQLHLFEMFTRLHTVPAEGLGLGLSIIHRMVSQMDGKVGVESFPGKGSTFWFTLNTTE